MKSQQMEYRNSGMSEEVHRPALFRYSIISLKYFLTLLFLSSRLFWGGGEGLYSQTIKIDSLRAILITAKEDTNKVKSIFRLSWEFHLLGNKDSSLFFGNASLALAEKLKFKGGVATICQSLGVVYSEHGNYTKALELYLKGLKIKEEIKDKKGIAGMAVNIGLLYSRQEDFDKALEHYFKALKISEDNGYKQQEANALGNIGIVYMERKEYPKASEYYSRAIKLDRELNNTEDLAADLCNLGIAFMNQKDYGNAIDNFFQSLKFAEEAGNKFGIGILSRNIGFIYTATGKYSEAEKYLLRSLNSSKEIGALDEERQAEYFLSEFYSKTKQHESAFQHHKKFIAIRDSIFSEENKKQLIRSEMNFEFDKKEAVIKEQREKERALAEEKNRFQKTVLAVVAGCLLLVTAFAFFIFRVLKTTRMQKLMIEEKQQEILDSIYYARRIQRALITNEKYFAKNLNRLNKL